MAKERGFYSEELMDEVARTGSVQGIDAVPQEVKELFKTSLEIDYKAHVNMQSVYQKHTNLAVSKTINMSNDATKDDVEQAYLMAYQSQCNGITIYRDGSKPTQVLEVPMRKDNEATAAKAFQGVRKRVRPSEMKGITERIRTGHGNMYVTVNFDEDQKPFEVFSSTLGKAGGCESAGMEAISRLISLALRSGIDPMEIVDQLMGITCVPAWDQGTLVGSPADAVALALERHTSDSPRGRAHQSFATQLKLDTTTYKPQAPENGNGNGLDVTHGHGSGVRCPDCNSMTVYQEGCQACLSCGWNRCE